MDFIIKRKSLIAMVFTALTMLGYFSYKQLAVELYPNATLPMLFVQVNTGLEVDPRTRGQPRKVRMFISIRD